MHSVLPSYAIFAIDSAGRNQWTQLMQYSVWLDGNVVKHGCQVQFLVYGLTKLILRPFDVIY